ncbi:MAG: sugar transferase [Fibrobacterota bacterium]
MQRFLDNFFVPILDLLFFNLVFRVIVWFRFDSGYYAFDPSRVFEYRDIAGAVFFFSVLLLLPFALAGFYRDWYTESRIDQFFSITKVVTFLTGILFLMVNIDSYRLSMSSGIFFEQLSNTRFTVYIVLWASLIFLLNFDRIIALGIKRLLYRKGIGCSNVLIIGANAEGEKLLQKINNYPERGMRVAGFIDDDGNKKGCDFAGLKVIGTYADIASVQKEKDVSSLIITRVTGSPNEIMRILKFCPEKSVSVFMEPDLYDVISGHFNTHLLYGFHLIELLPDHMRPWEVFTKRMIDILISLFVLIVFLPVWIIVAFIIKTVSPGPVFYKQKRVGRDWKEFNMYKFRSMDVDAEKKSGPVWASEEDPRIFKFGKFMRKTRIDEVPQFWNILKGDMSLVGPRPERKFFIDKLMKEIPFYIRRIKMKPGLTGWAQVKHKYDESIEDVKEKVMYDLYYFENMSILLDIKIILRTFLVVLTAKGAK